MIVFGNTSDTDLTIPMDTEEFRAAKLVSKCGENMIIGHVRVMRNVNF